MSVFQFWLIIFFQFVTLWDNSILKAETRPEHFQYTVKWSEKNLKCRNKDDVKTTVSYPKLLEK